jgi:hypothetical protein
MTENSLYFEEAQSLKLKMQSHNVKLSPRLASLVEAGYQLWLCV